MNKVRQEIYHGSFNLDGRDNLQEIPREAAVFAIFAIVDGEPVNCRYVSYATNLADAVCQLFENPPTPGLKEFMQGPWVPMLVFEMRTDATEVELQEEVAGWKTTYSPRIDDAGEYPGYYEN